MQWALSMLLFQQLPGPVFSQYSPTLDLTAAHKGPAASGKTGTEQSSARRGNAQGWPADSLGHLVDTGLVADQYRRVEDVPLSWGRMTSGIVRRGERLLRPMGPWSPAVHEYLRHLETAGFEGSLRVLGIEDNREVLTFIDGDVAVDPQWQPGHGNRLPPYARTDLALRGAADLLRKLHSAATGFQPAITGYRFHPHPPRAGEIIGLPTGRRSCLHWSAACWPGQQTGRATPLTPPRCNGSKASRWNSPAHYDSHQVCQNIAERPRGSLTSSNACSSGP
jgi:hypothetical protein